MIDKLHFFWRSIHLYAVDFKLVIVEIYRQLVKGDDLFFIWILLAASAEHCLDAGEYLFWLEGLYNIIVCSELKTEYLVKSLSLSCEHYDRALGLLAYLTADLEPVLLRKHDVKQNYVRTLLFKALDRLATVVSYRDSIAFLSISDMKRIGDSHLPSIDFIDINEDRFKFDGTLTDRAGIKHLVKINGKLISPEHLSYLGLRSAITGKPIPVLKPGDIIMTKGMLERTFGKDVNPIGFTVSNGFFVGRYVTNNVIKDVVDTGDWMLTEDCLMLVATPFLQEFKGDDFIETSMLSSFNVILAKGKTADDLKKDLQKTLPEYNIKVLADGYASRQTRLLVIFTFILCSCILLIGLFGFLKTQIQLFRLRQREMGLRQCMGAQREQLFGLMMPKGSKKDVVAKMVVSAIGKKSMDKYEISVAMEIPGGKVIAAKDECSNVFAGIDLVEAKLTGQIRRYKLEAQPHRRKKSWRNLFIKRK